MGLFADNPVIQHELRRRRGWRGPLILAIVNGVLAGGAALVVATLTVMLQAAGEDGFSTWYTPIAMLVISTWWLAAIALPHLMAFTIVTAIASPVLAKERELQTFELLRLTHLTPGQFLAGKLLLPLGYALAVLPLPLTVLGWLAWSPPWGSSRLEEQGVYHVGIYFSHQYPLLLAWSALCLFGSLWISAHAKNTRVAAVGSFALLAGVGTVTGILALIVRSALESLLQPDWTYDTSTSFPRPEPYAWLYSASAGLTYWIIGIALSALICGVLAYVATRRAWRAG